MPAPIALNAATAAQLETAFNKHINTMDATNQRIDEVTELIHNVEAGIDNMRANGQLPAAGARAGANAHGGASRIAKQFTDSEQFQAFKNGMPSTGRVSIDSGIAGLRNATTLTSDGGGYGTGTQWSPRLGNVPTRKLQLLDVIPSIQVETGSYAYNVVEGYINSTATQVHQGDAKAQGSVPAQLITANISTLAVWTRFSQQVMQDSTQLVGQLANLLTYSVRQTLEQKIVNATGGTGEIDGLLSLGTAYTSAATTAIDKVGDSITHLASLGWQASVVALNPADWWAMAEAKASGSGEYLLASPGQATEPMLWGVPVAIVPSLPAGTAVVMDASQTALLDRQSVALMLSRDDSDNFQRNLCSALCEVRAGLAVFSPSAVLSVDLASGG